MQRREPGQLGQGFPRDGGRRGLAFPRGCDPRGQDQARQHQGQEVALVVDDGQAQALGPAQGLHHREPHEGGVAQGAGQDQGAVGLGRIREDPFAQPEDQRPRPEQQPGQDHGGQYAGVQGHVVDVQQGHGRHGDVDDEAVEDVRGVLRQFAQPAQKQAEGEADDDEQEIGHGPSYASPAGKASPAGRRDHLPAAWPRARVSSLIRAGSSSFCPSSSRTKNRSATASTLVVMRAWCTVRPMPARVLARS